MTCSSPPLPVEYGGCTAILKNGPTCILSAGYRELRLWIPWSALPAGTPLEIRINGKLVPGQEPKAVGSGQKWTVEVSSCETARSIELKGGEGRWSLDLAEDDGGIILRSKKHSAAVQCQNQNGTVSRCLALINEVIGIDQKTGQWLDETRDRTTLAHWYINDRRFDKARHELEMLENRNGKDPAKIAFYKKYYWGLLAYRTEDYRSALKELKAARGYAERTGPLIDSWFARQTLGLQYRALGRFDEAIAEFSVPADLRPEKLGCDDEAIFHNNRGWTLLMAEAAGKSFGNPSPDLEKAYQLARRCLPGQRTNASINLALAYLQEGRLADATAKFEEAKTQRAVTPLEQIWLLDLEARIAFRSGDAKRARDLFELLKQKSAGSTEGQWLALYDRAQVCKAQNNRECALNALQESEKLLDDRSRQVPINEGREAFLEQREDGTSLYVELLLDAHREEEALRVVRQARTRVLRQLVFWNLLAGLSPPQRREWEEKLAAYLAAQNELNQPGDDSAMTLGELYQKKLRAQELRSKLTELLDGLLALPGREQELPAYRPGEVLLAYHPLSRKGEWVGFAASSQGVTAHRFELPEAPARLKDLAHVLLEPFHSEIELASRVRILTPGKLQDVDFQALPFGREGDVLLSSKPVIYGLDLPSGTSPSPVETRQALVVSDPKGDLPGARQEAKDVSDALERAGWTVKPLREKDATASKVTEALAGSGLLHVAGHGKAQGPGGWESEILLADESSLTPGDILLKKVPAWVDLAGCETGRSSATSAAGMGLAQSFLLAGSHAVISSVRKVNDQTAADLARALYKKPWGAKPDLAALLWQAQLKIRESHPADWANFRVFEP